MSCLGTDIEGFDIFLLFTRPGNRDRIISLRACACTHNNIADKTHGLAGLSCAPRTRKLYTKGSKFLYSSCTAGFIVDGGGGGDDPYLAGSWKHKGALNQNLHLNNV